jgi:hypothetical protein
MASASDMPRNVLKGKPVLKGSPFDLDKPDCRTRPQSGCPCSCPGSNVLMTIPRGNNKPSASGQPMRRARGPRKVEEGPRRTRKPATRDHRQRLPSGTHSVSGDSKGREPVKLGGTLVSSKVSRRRAGEQDVECIRGSRPETSASGNGCALALGRGNVTDVNPSGGITLNYAAIGRRNEILRQP